MSSLLFIIILIALIVIIKKNIDKKKVDSGNYDHAIAQLTGYYDTTRSNLEALGASVISISTYWFESEGKADSSSSYMSVCVREGTNDSLANSLGMNVSMIEGKMNYQFVLKGKYSRTVKREIIKKLAESLRNIYPDDVFEIDESIPALFAMVNSRRMYEMLGRLK